MSKPSPPNSFVRHVVDRTGPYSKITDKARKDSYSALILGSWMVKILHDMQNVKKEVIPSTFSPMFIS